jgi:putative sterol carrier protein
MKKIFLAVALAANASLAGAAPVLMTPDWMAQACEAWNANSVLTTELAEKWIKNDKNRGYKIVHMYRTECGEGGQVEMKIVRKDGKAMCVYGGKPENNPDFDVDYLMHANSPRWDEMGKGEYGPMKAMMFGRLEFSGPMMEAMGVMGPFEQFLLLVGKVPSDAASCPPAQKP